MGFRESVYLIITRRGVDRMTKRLPDTRRGEFVIKINVQAADSAFREPTLVREIVITDPFDGLTPDIEFSQPFITEAEAAQIRGRRKQQLIELLEADGYKISPPDPEPEPEDEMFHDGTG